MKKRKLLKKKPLTPVQKLKAVVADKDKLIGLERERVADFRAQKQGVDRKLDEQVKAMRFINQIVNMDIRNGVPMGIGDYIPHSMGTTDKPRPVVQTAVEVAELERILGRHEGRMEALREFVAKYGDQGDAQRRY